MKLFSHYDLAVLCNRVYDKPDRDLLTISEIDCLVKRRGDTVALCFRGTEASNAWPMKWSKAGLSNSRDIIRDLRAWPWKDPISECWVHKGFGWSAYTWWKEFHRGLSLGVKLVVTGHSLGAAIAPMVARSLVLSGLDVEECVVFGEPRGHYWGSDKNYRELDIPTTSYRNKNDPIRFAGLGSHSVPVTVIDPGLECLKSHSIDVYAGMMK